jgi:hypothetical protein
VKDAKIELPGLKIASSEERHLAEAAEPFVLKSWKNRLRVFGTLNGFFFLYFALFIWVPDPGPSEGSNYKNRLQYLCYLPYVFFRYSSIYALDKSVLSLAYLRWEERKAENSKTREIIFRGYFLLHTNVCGPHIYSITL